MGEIEEEILKLQRTRTLLGWLCR